MDGEFDLLRRCWCIAEIVRTSNSGIPQNTLMLSADAMDDHYGLLARLDVRECEASNKADKDFILGKIQDIASFNAKLQWLVFSKQGIFNRHVNCPQARVQAAARVAARVLKTRSTVSSNASAGTARRSRSETDELYSRRGGPGLDYSLWRVPPCRLSRACCAKSSSDSSSSSDSGSGDSVGRE
uniref:Uncharacterized protein n=1 Tax=Alexandrium catenella TaxID=2925 RepID=A0A7S1LUN3_ALECA